MRRFLLFIACATFVAPCTYSFDNSEDEQRAADNLRRAGYSESEVQAAMEVLKKNLYIQTDTEEPKRNNSSETTLYSSVLSNNLEAAQSLIRKGADVNGGPGARNTPLIASIIYANVSLVKLLLKNHADPNKARPDGVTPLHLASVLGTETWARAAGEEGLNNNGEDGLRKMALLLKHGANVHAKDENESTPLLWAAGYGNLDGIRLLLSYGANRNDVDSKGLSALELATKKFSNDVKKAREVRRLLEPDWFVRTCYALRDVATKVAIVIPIALLGYFFRTRLKKRQPKLIAGKRYKFSCPHCGQHISVTPDLAGTTQNCPTCSHEFLVPPPKSENGPIGGGAENLLPNGKSGDNLDDPAGESGFASSQFTKATDGKKATTWLTNAASKNTAILLLGVAAGVIVTLASLYLGTRFLRPKNASEPKYIERVLNRSGGVDGIRIILRFKDDEDEDTAATGKVQVEIYDGDERGLIASETFHISQADFKMTEYGLWEAYMITLPRIKYRSAPKSASGYGEAKVFFTSIKGTKIKGEGSVNLKP